jgi:Tol biopolymer transport system component
MSMRAWLALLATLPLLVVGSGGIATAGTSDPPRNGLIAAVGVDGIYLIDAQSKEARKVPGTTEMGEPRWSPDGTLLAIEGWDDSGSAVYTIRPDGSDRRLVLRNAASPSWSPDGKRLVVSREDENGSILVIVGVDGSDAQPLTYNGHEPVWSPDGKWIAFVGHKGAVNLVRPDGEDDGVRTIAHIADAGWNLAWSPDASKLAFDAPVKAHDYRPEIAVFDLATDRLTTLPSRKEISAVAWSPDGRQLAFLSSRPMPVMPQGGHGCGGETPMDLWVMNVDGSNPHRLSKGSYGPPSWGTFQPAPLPSTKPEPKPSAKPVPKPSSQPEPKPSSKPKSKPSTKPVPKPTVGSLVSAPATNAKKSSRTAPRVVATAATRSELGDGQIAARGRDALYLIDPHRGSVRRIPGTAKMAQPLWSPDGSLLAVERANGNGSSVYTIRPDGRNQRLVIKNASLLSWSPDGNRLFVAPKRCLAPRCDVDEDEPTNLLTVRIDGSDARAVDFENDEFSDASEPAFPPDGNWIAFFADEAANPASFDSSTMAWSPGGDQLAFVASSPATAKGVSAEDASSGLWVVAADAGKPQLLATGIYGRPSWGGYQTG